MLEMRPCVCPQCGTEYKGAIDDEDPCPVAKTVRRDGKDVRIYRQMCWRCLERKAAPAFKDWVAARSDK